MGNLVRSGSPAPMAGREISGAVVPFDLNDIAPVSWKNGGGTTREIACWPINSNIETFDWRISVARIDRNGPFSTFSGVDRVITLLDGAGVTLLDENGTSHALTQPLKPHAFDGEASIYGELIAGSSEDLNIMVRRGRIHASVSVLDDAASLPVAGAGMLLAVGACWHLHASDGTPYTLAPGQGVWWGGQPTAWSVHFGTTSAAATSRGLIAIALHDIRAPGALGDTI